MTSHARVTRPAPLSSSQQMALPVSTTPPAGSPECVEGETRDDQKRDGCSSQSPLPGAPTLNRNRGLSRLDRMVQCLWRKSQRPSISLATCRNAN